MRTAEKRATRDPIDLDPRGNAEVNRKVNPHPVQVGSPSPHPAPPREFLLSAGDGPRVDTAVGAREERHVRVLGALSWLLNGTNVEGTALQDGRRSKGISWPNLSRATKKPGERAEASALAH
eukprot:scaffold416_cov329-Pavlova_lutheri.AAC.15